MSSSLVYFVRRGSNEFCAGGALAGDLPGRVALMASGMSRLIVAAVAGEAPLHLVISLPSGQTVHTGMLISATAGAPPPEYGWG